MAEKYGVSISSVQRYIKQTSSKVIILADSASTSIVVQMDTTYWGRNFGVVIFLDAATHRVLHFRFLRSKERVSDYQAGIAYLQSQGYVIQAIVSDLLPGIKKAFPNIAYQYCQFHQLLRIKHLLTSRPRLPAAGELKTLTRQLTRTKKKNFVRAPAKWESKWEDFLKEKTCGEDGKWHFTHRKTRSAFYSLKRNLDALFVFENFPEKQVPRTNNAIESLNALLKMKLHRHRGLSIEKRELLIANILMAYNPYQYRPSRDV